MRARRARQHQLHGCSCVQVATRLRVARLRAVQNQQPRPLAGRLQRRRVAVHRQRQVPSAVPAVVGKQRVSRKQMREARSALHAQLALATAAARVRHCRVQSARWKHSG
jgi:hypothetical protein